jgi:hypothetical protein
MLIVLRDGLSQLEYGKLVIYQPGAVVDFAPHIAQSMIDRGRATPYQTPPEPPKPPPAPNHATTAKRTPGRPKKGQ